MVSDGEQVGLERFLCSLYPSLGTHTPVGNTPSAQVSRPRVTLEPFSGICRGTFPTENVCLLTEYVPISQHASTTLAAARLE